MTGHIDFEQELRARHALAVAHVSTHTRTQLRNRLQAAITPRTHAPSVHARHGWALAGAFVLLFALGIEWRPGMESPVPDQGTPIAAGADGDVIATLDENPDFYLWLASTDAVALASE